MKDLSIIIVSYNTKELLVRCLASVKKDVEDTTLSLEIIIIDNGSNDTSVEYARKFKAQSSKLKVIIVENKDNVGFAKANNQGAKIAMGRYLLFLNSDTTVGQHALQKMVEFMDQHPHVGIASCQLRNSDGSIQPQGGFLPRLSTVAIWAFFLDDVPILHNALPSYQLRRKSFFTGIPKHIGWVGGTAMWMRRETWEKLNGFDEHIFMYGEDVDLCVRTRKNGWQVMINPSVSIIHVGGASSPSPEWVVGEVRGLLYLFHKHKPAWELPILKLVLAVGMSLRWFIFGILGRDEELKRAYAQAARLARQ